MRKHTAGPWHVYHPMIDGNPAGTYGVDNEAGVAVVWHGQTKEDGIRRLEDARLIAAAPTQHEEMLRYLPIIERAESDPELWEKLTAGTGIATANGYRGAIAKATGAAE